MATENTTTQHELCGRSIIQPALTPAEGYSAEAILAAYRLRWQIELAFKRLKSLIHIDKLVARTNLGARSWLYPHLIVALLCDDLSQDFLDAFPCGPVRCRLSAIAVDGTEDGTPGAGRCHPRSDHHPGDRAADSAPAQSMRQCTTKAKTPRHIPKTELILAPVGRPPLADPGQPMALLALPC